MGSDLEVFGQGGEGGGVWGGGDGGVCVGKWKWRVGGLGRGGDRIEDGVEDGVEG